MTLVILNWLKDEGWRAVAMIFGALFLFHVSRNESQWEDAGADPDRGHPWWGMLFRGSVVGAIASGVAYLVTLGGV